jgi:class 3 adenylate cyclase
MMQAVHHVEGTVNQMIGGGIMAPFGAPIAHEDHAVRRIVRSNALSRRRWGSRPRQSRL